MLIGIIIKHTQNASLPESPVMIALVIEIESNNKGPINDERPIIPIPL